MLSVMQHKNILSEKPYCILYFTIPVITMKTSLFAQGILPRMKESALYKCGLYHDIMRQDDYTKREKMAIA